MNKNNLKHTIIIINYHSNILSKWTNENDDGHIKGFLFTDNIESLKNLITLLLYYVLVWDASAKQAVGLLSGNRFQLGDFDECLQVAKPIKAQYCLVDVKLDVPSQYSYADPLAREYDPLLPAWHKIYVRKFFSASRGELNPQTAYIL